MAIDGGGLVINNHQGSGAACGAQCAAGSCAARSPRTAGRGPPATGHRPPAPPHKVTNHPLKKKRRRGACVWRVCCAGPSCPPPQQTMGGPQNQPGAAPPRGLANTHLLSLPQWHWGCTNCKLPFLALPEWQGNTLPPQQCLLV